jgi:hypothetical protein
MVRQECLTYHSKSFFFLTNELNRSIYSPIKDDVIFDLDLKIKNVILRAQIIILANKKPITFSRLWRDPAKSGKTNRRVL